MALAEWQGILTQRTAQLERELDRLAGLRARWTQTRTEAQAAGALAAVVQRVDAVLADLEATRAPLQAQRDATLVLQDTVAQEVARCEDALARIVRFRQDAMKQTFVRTTLPIWSPELRGRALAEWPARIREEVIAGGALLRQFVEDNAVRVFLHGLLFIGLIVLVERPIHLGDAIRMSDVEGEVQRIGIRSTTVRTSEGAEVIVPNASLVAEKVTKWTHSDRLRRLGVLAEPAPLALFLGFGDSALNFELRAWTDRFDQWAVIRERAESRRVRGAGEGGDGDPIPPARGAPAAGVRAERKSFAP